MIKYEAEMFEPLKSFFEGKGYKVNAEVKDCDMTAVKGDEIIILELKRGFTMPLVYQLLERRELFSLVYAVIPRPKSLKGRRVRDMLKLAKKLGVGIITVGLDSGFKSVDVLLEPSDEGEPKLNKRRKQKKSAIINEIERRRAEDKNTGGISGSEGQKIMTAYREASLAVLCFGENKELILIGELPQTHKGVLQTNYYGWFKRVARGKYIISDKGRQALEADAFINVINFYRKEENMLCLK